jgi:hypothetical protein
VCTLQRSQGSTALSTGQFRDDHPKKLLMNLSVKARRGVTMQKRATALQTALERPPLERDRPVLASVEHRIKRTCR